MAMSSDATSTPNRKVKEILFQSQNLIVDTIQRFYVTRRGQPEDSESNPVRVYLLIA